MALTKLGNFIETLDLRNSDDKYGEKSVVGLSTQKTIITTKADLSGVKLSSYKLFPPKSFAYVPDTSRRGDKMSMAYNSSNETYLVSSISIVFKVIKPDKLISDYLFMFFNRPEFDRYSRFNSWGSARETFSWNEMQNIEIDLPPVDVQQKYVNIYKSMLENQKCYETALDDLKLVCDAYIEDLRKKYPSCKIGQYITKRDERNSDNSIKNVMGISVTKEFRLPTSKVKRDELASYKIVRPNDIAFVQTTHNEKVFAFACNLTNNNIVVSSVNEVFFTDTKYLLPDYLSLYFMRKEFDRYARFHSWGTARETFTLKDVSDVEIPIPDIEIQRSIADIYKVYMERKQINEHLKAQIKNICPILIKGSLNEGK
ncbi:MAG: restriction endonuclease subunit S [Ruminococcus sp.]|nr:restriction endonuclease subunit S [Ruminococcus sp.]